MAIEKKRSFNLLRRFALLSFLSIGLITAVSSFLLSNFLTHNMLQRDAVVTMEFVQTIAQAENTRSYFETDDPGKTKTVFEAFFKQIATMPEVVRANVYNSNGSILWSDDDRFIGHRFSPNPQLETALSGKLAVTSGTSGKSSKPEHVFDQEVPFFAEIYIPIWNIRENKVVGVVEVYKVPLTLFHAIKQGNRLVWLSAGLGGLFLYASLFWIVRRAAQVIRRQQEQLVESETMAAIGEMASAVAHGIRNPLASIRSSAEVALEESPPFRATAEEIIHETDRIEDWIRELLVYSKPPSGNPASIQINGLIQSTLDSLDREIKKRNVKLTQKLDPASPLVHADEGLMRHVLISLIANSLDAMPDGGELTVSSRIEKSDSRVEVVIKDTGCGIPIEQMDKIFKPFYTTKSKGMGVGLSLAKRIIERHGGILRLESEAAVGTTVFMHIPLAR
ncbi:sensor histidine kinase [Candidatus Manganitrophus noduliformans]|uniref:histidine kinase n=1 Tax=Candidatus Manganitrophus noduliformans TaxID=2606439 RepID=A0A7X6DPE2_9BACT|nr:ATP-binding protein [Candidatus Manganitrophus noduliformans]NKE70852.1 two-component sensor histidine kinase [Candidatus Manganitrophus noduliformans]